MHFPADLSGLSEEQLDELSVELHRELIRLEGEVTLARQKVGRRRSDIKASAKGLGFDFTIFGLGLIASLPSGPLGLFLTTFGLIRLVLRTEQIATEGGHFQSESRDLMALTQRIGSYLEYDARLTDERRRRMNH